MIAPVRRSMALRSSRGGAGLVVLDLRHGLDDERALDRAERHAVRRKRGAGARG
jgi:hypothetical protein